MPVAEKLCRNQKELGGIKREVRTNEPLIAVKVSHVVRWQKHDVIFGGIQMAVCAINNECLGQGNAALRLEVGNHKLMPLTLWFLGAVWLVILSKQRADEGELQGGELQNQQQGKLAYVHGQWVLFSERHLRRQDVRASGKHPITVNLNCRAQ